MDPTTIWHRLSDGITLNVVCWRQAWIWLCTALRGRHSPCLSRDQPRTRTSHSQGASVFNKHEGNAGVPTSFPHEHAPTWHWTKSKFYSRLCPLVCCGTERVSGSPHCACWKALPRGVFGAAGQSNSTQSHFWNGANNALQSEVKHKVELWGSHLLHYNRKDNYSLEWYIIRTIVVCVSAGWLAPAIEIVGSPARLRKNA